MVYETIELTFYATKIIYNCLHYGYTKFFSKQDDVMMIELQDLKKRIECLEHKE